MLLQLQLPPILQGELHYGPLRAKGMAESGEPQYSAWL